MEIIDRQEDEPDRTERGRRDQFQCSGKDGEKRIYLNGKPVQNLYCAGL